MAGMIERGEIQGLISNPTLFTKAIAELQDYDADLEPPFAAGWSAEEIFWQLAVEDIQAAANPFRRLYEEGNGGEAIAQLKGVDREHSSC